MRLSRICFIVVLACISGIAAIKEVAAAIIFQGGYNFREIVGNPPPNYAQGPDRLIFGLQVIDDGTDLVPVNAVVFAKNLGSGEVVSLRRYGSFGYTGSVAYSAERALGEWVIEVNSDAGTASTVLPPLGTGAGTGAIPLLVNLSAIPGAQPEFSWEIPANLASANDGNIDRFRMRMNDSNGRQILNHLFDPTATATTYQTPPGVIRHNGAFVGRAMVEGLTPYGRSVIHEPFVVENVGVGGQAINFDFVSSYLDVRGNNSVRWQPGERIGVDINIDVSADSYAYAENGGEIMPLRQSPEPDRKFEFGTSGTRKPNLEGNWNVVVWNGAVSSSAVAQGFGSVKVLPYIRNFRVQPDNLTPTIRWELPDGTFDKVQIGLFDDVNNFRLSVFGPLRNQLFHTMDAPATEFTFENGMLQENGKYVVRVVLSDFDDVDGRLLNRSISFHNLLPMEPLADGGEVYLPSMDEGGVYEFDFDVIEAEPYPIDPLIAIGYDYAVGEGDPFFASVTLPDEGDGMYDLILYDSEGEPLPPILLAAGETHEFSSAVDRFRVLGIETSAGLDPNNATAFITTLTFADSGAFTGSMTPITEFVPDVATANVEVLSKKINLRKYGSVPVVLYGEDDFDVSALSLVDVHFGPASARPKHDIYDEATRAGHTKDVNGDGHNDLVVHFETIDTGITDTTLEACLNVIAQQGIIGGCDDIVVK